MLKVLFMLIVAFISTEHCYEINDKLFPENFMFGAASSSYQIEGGWNVDGKTESIWDYYIHNNPEIIKDGSTGDVSCDSYHKYEVDVALLKELGVTHYRFSISWPRILPNGTSDVINLAGVIYYMNLINLLKQNNITPIVTLYHWDLPQVLENQGGFLNESIVLWFANYAKVCFDIFGNDVKYWLTFNEPAAICSYGYGYGLMAPGVEWPAQGDYICAHNLIKAHATAWHAYDEEYRQNQTGQVSMVHAIQWSGPLTNSSEDQNASEQKMQFDLGWWAHPLYFGDYPDIMKHRIANRSALEGFNESRLPEFTDAEKEFVKGTSDFFAFNTYGSSQCEAIPEPEISLPPSIYNDTGVGVISNEGDGSWGMIPLLKWIQSNYDDPAIIIMENGLGNEGGVEDNDRIERIRAFMSRTRDAMDDGVTVFGYTVWSLLDNFEWTSGYTVKFGLYEVDFSSENKTRTPRSSAKWYNELIASRCLVENCE